MSMHLIQSSTHISYPYLHGVCFSRWSLSICKDCPIVTLQDICRTSQTTWSRKKFNGLYSISLLHMALDNGRGEWTPTSIQTFDNLLSAGIVHLLLCCVWLEHSVKHVGLALEKRHEEWAVSSDDADRDVKTLLHVQRKRLSSF